MADSRTHIVLVGLPGAGKSVIGRRLARALQRPFVDMDTDIARRARATVPVIFAEQGEEAFRAMERGFTAELARRSASVVAPGGGWITRPDTVAILRPPAKLIYLKAKVQTAIRQMGVGIARRPLLAGPDPAARLTLLLAQRAPAYEAADFVIDVDDIEPQEVTRRIVGLLPPLELPAGYLIDAGG